MKKRIFTALLAAAVVFSTSLPAFASEKIGAQNNEAAFFESESDTNEKEWGGGVSSDYPSQVILGFSPLPENVAKQELTVGSSEEIVLPESLEVTVSSKQDSIIGQSGEERAEEESISLPVTWEAQPEFQRDTAGEYLFTPSWEESYEISSQAIVPTIDVLVEQPQLLAQTELNEQYLLTNASEIVRNRPWDPVTEQFKGQTIDYDGWQLMELDIKIPTAAGLEVTEILPKTPSLYPEYSTVEKTEKEWNYSYYFKQNGTYEFTVKYNLNGTEGEATLSYTVEGLVSIQDIVMRYYLLYDGGFSVHDEYGYHNYLTEDSLSQKTYGWGFGQGSDDKNTVKSLTSLDGLQYVSGMVNCYIFPCEKIDSIEPLTQGYYPNLTHFRPTEISDNSTKLNPNSYTPEMLADAVRKMPNLQEFSANGTGYKDFTVFADTNPTLLSIYSSYNGVTSLKGLEKQPKVHLLYLAKNELTSIEELRAMEKFTFLDIGYNHISDLTPIANNLQGTAGKTFSAREQTVTVPTAVQSQNTDNSYIVELPMPIDIDGSLTDSSSVKVTYADGTSKSYIPYTKNGKSYIEIPKQDVPHHDADADAFQGAKFTADFNNNNGTDERTKEWFNGTVDFKVTSKEIPEKVLWYCDIYLQKEDEMFYLWSTSQMDWEKPGVEVSVSAADFDGKETGWGETLGKDYVFDEDNPNNVLTGIVSADEKTVLKIYYKLPSHKVIYQYEGMVPTGAPSLPAPDDVDVGEEFRFEEYPTYPGYIFGNVHTNDPNVEINEEDHTITMTDHDVIIYGSWIKLHTVTFDPQGGKWSDGTTGNLIKQIPNNELINEVLPILTKDGYSFKGWFTQPVGGEQYRFNQPVTGDMTLYAHWESLVKEVTVTFDENGGDTPANPNQMKLNQGTALNQLPTPPQKAGYVFREWNTQKDGSGDTFTETTIVEQDMTVYAQWEKEQDRPIIPEKPTDPTNPDRPHRPSRPENDGNDSDSVPMTSVRPQKESPSKEVTPTDKQETIGEQQDSSAKKQDKYNPSTGESTHFGLALAGMAVSSCVVLALCRKKD